MSTIESDGLIYDSETGELLNEVEQVEVEVIEDTLPDIICNGGTHIKTNTEQLKKELVKYLEKYDIEVTQDTEKDEEGNILSIGEKDASKMATELNKLAKDLNTKRLAVGKEIKKPADELKNSIDELIKLVQDKRVSILEDVEVYKQKRFTIIRHKLEQHRDKLFEDMKVSDSYRFLDIDVLVVEGSMGKSELSKKAKESLESMVRAIKAIEDAVTIRTLQLKVTCLDAGLEYPIELHEVQRFIKDNDYDDKLKVMIDARLQVEKQVKEKAEKEAEAKRLAFAQEEERKAREAKMLEEQAKIQAEQDRLSEIQRIEDEKNAEIARIKREAEEKEQARIAEEQRAIKEEKERLAKIEADKLAQEQATGKKVITLVATFEMEVARNIKEEDVLDRFKTKLLEVSSTFKDIEIR